MGGYKIPLNFGPYGNYGTANYPGAQPQGATMPHAAFLIPAAASLAGSAISAISGGKATKAQTKANDQALAYQRQQDTMSRADWNKAMQAWEANRNQLLQRYGIPIQQAQAQPQRVAQVPGQPMPSGPGQPAPAQYEQLRGVPGNLEDLMRRGYTGQRLG